MIGYIILAVLLILVAIILIRAAMFKPQKNIPSTAEDVSVNEEKIISDMVAMIKCKTVSYTETELEDEEEFEKFRSLLKERFPNIHSVSNQQRIGRNGILYKIEGKSSQSPTVCMAHYDVVPVDEEGWEKPPFEGIVENGYIWGRGTLDTKGTLLGVMEALELLLCENYTPQNDLYLSFSGEEEINGNSCADIVSYLEQNDIKPALVLDEGGAVVENVFPGVKNKCAVVGIAEKGGVNYKFSLNSKGGHSSTPPVRTNLGIISKAVCSIEKHPFKFQLTRPAKELFDTLGRHSNFGLKIIFANLWLFSPVLNLICKKSGGELNALVRTTAAVTRMKGSDAYNVLPPRVSFGVNVRLIGNDTIESAIEHFKKVIKNDNIKIEYVNGTNPSAVSNTDCEQWDKLGNAITQTWPDAIVTPYLMMACSDSRHYCRICENVYRFSAMHLSKEERGMIHGDNERVPIETLVKTTEFYVRFLKML